MTKDSNRVNIDEEKNIDREIEILLKEYETLRSEVLAREASRIQIIGVAIFLIGAITAVAPFLLHQGVQGLQTVISLQYFIVILLVVSMLFSSLYWAYMLHDVEVSHIGNYILNIRMRACQLINLEETSAHIFNWDHYHVNKLSQSSSVYFANIALSCSRYVILICPAVISLLAASWLYVVNFPVIPISAEAWGGIVFFAFDLLYLLASVPVVINLNNNYQTIIHSAKKKVLLELH